VRVTTPKMTISVNVCH